MTKTAQMTELAPGYSFDSDRGIVVIDPDIAYPEILKALEVPKSKYDQYWLEVAVQCAKLEAQRLVEGTEFDPRPNKPLVININSRKDNWAIAGHPEGRGAMAATRGLEAKRHYATWRSQNEDLSGQDYPEVIQDDNDYDADNEYNTDNDYDAD